MEYSIIQDSRLLKRFIIGSNSLPPDKAYLFDAKQQIFNKNQIRIIYFGGQKFTEKEEKSVDLTINILKSEDSLILKKILPPFYNESKLRGVILQNLYENEFQLDKIKDKICQQINLRSVILKKQFNENSFRLLTDGYLYCFGRDKCFRPIICAKFNGTEKFIMSIVKQEIKIASLYLILYIQNYMLLDGQVENGFFIIDLDSSDLSSSIRDFILQIIFPIDLIFKAFIFKIIVVNSKNLEMKYKEKIKKSVNRIFLNEIEFYSESNPTILMEYISKNQLQIHYGGNAKIDEYWPPNIPNDEFEENISNIMPKEMYKNALINNEFMIPHPDMSLELRKLRKKIGNIEHKEFVYKTYKERRNSYNGIDERIQLDAELVTKMLNNSGLISEITSKNTSFYQSDVGSENKPTQAVNPNYAIMLNEIKIQLKKEIQNSKEVQLNLPIQELRPAKINETFKKPFSIIHSQYLNNILDKEINETHNPQTRNVSEVPKEEIINNLTHIQEDLYSKNVHERKITPPHDPLVLNTKSLLNSNEINEYHNQNNCNESNVMNSINKGSNQTENHLIEEENVLAPKKNDLTDEQKVPHEEKCKNLLNKICENKTFKSEIIENVKINTATTNPESKLECETQIDFNNHYSSNREKLIKEDSKFHLKVIPVSPESKQAIINQQIQMDSEGKESKYSIYPPSSPCTVTSPPPLDCKQFKPKFSTKFSNSDENNSNICKCFQNCC